MKEKYHTNKAGVVAKCQATIRACRFGGDEAHHSTAEEAREAYEKSMESKVLVGSTKKVYGIEPDQKPKRKASELNALAKSTDKIEDFREIVQYGSERALKNISVNPKATDEVLAAAYDLSEDTDTKKALMLHANYPVSKLSGNEFISKLGKLDTKQALTLASSPGVNDEHYLAVRKTNSGKAITAAFAMLQSNNDLSQKLVISQAESHQNLLSQAIKGSKYPANRISKLDTKLISSNDAGRAKSPYLEGYADWSVKNKSDDIANAVASNPNADDAVLRRLSTRGLAFERVYTHPKASEETRSLAVKNSTSQDTAAIVKIDTLNRAIPGGLKKSIVDDSQRKNLSRINNRGYTETVTHLDKNKVKQYGLNEQDIKYLFKAKNFNAGFSYDEAEGTVTGRVDSTD